MILASLQALARAVFCTTFPAVKEPFTVSSPFHI